MTTTTMSRCRLKSLPLVGALVFSLSLLFVTPALAAQEKAQWVADELLVQFRAGTNQTAMDKEFKEAGATLEKEIDRIKVKRIKVLEANREKVKARLVKNPQVEFVEENFLAQGMLVPSDSSYPSQWHLPKIAAPQGWDITTGDVNFPIAIIDSGIDADHPDLMNKLVTGRNFLTGTTITDDTYGHGTAVAGASGAIGNNALGVAGVAWNNPLMPLLVLDPNNSATYSNIASAIIYAADHGAKVINMSLAGSSSSYTLQNAINYAWSKGVVIVAAAGNYNVSTLYYPAACDNVVAVAATDSADAKASYSNFGSWIDLTAPGSGIYTTSKGGVYGSWSGTSFSSPIVAGLAGLIWAANPALTNAEVVNIMKQGANDLGAAGFDVYFGFGRVNACNSLTLARNFVATRDLTAPEAAIVTPSDGATVGGTTVVNVSANDNLAVSRVDLLIDGTVFATDSTAPYNFTWNTAGLADGWRTLSAVAYDAAGNAGRADYIMTLVSNPTDTAPPTVTIVSPYNGATVTKKVSISVRASDNVGVNRIELYLDGKLLKTAYAETLSLSLNTTSLTAGFHTLQAKAFDAAGNLDDDPVVIYK